MRAIDRLRQDVSKATVVVAVLFGLMLGGTMFSAPLDSSVTSDDGAYAYQVETLHDGDWSWDHVLADVDPEGRAYPLVNAEISSEGYFPYVRKPAWPHTLLAADRIGGVLGMRLVPAAFALGTVLLMLPLARLTGHGAAAPFAAAAVAASPLAFNGLGLWAHAPATFFFTASVVLVLAAISSPYRSREMVVALGGIVALALAVTSRSESALFGLGLAVSLIVAAALRRRAFPAVLGLALAATAVFTQVANGRWAAAIMGDGGSGSATVGRSSGSASGRLTGFVQTFVSASGADPVGLFLALVALVLVGVAVVLLRNDDPRWSGVALLAAAFWVLRIVVAPEAALSGLLAAWPVLLFLLAGVRRFEQREWMLLSTCAVGAVGVALTQYDGGGGLNWGGRFVLTAVPLLAVVVAPTLRELWVGAVGDTDRRRLAVASLLVLPLVGSLVFDHRSRVRHDQVIAVAEQADLGVPIVTDAVALPRLAWRTAGDIRWLLPPRSSSSDARDDFRGLRDLLIAGGIDQVGVYGLDGAEASVLAGHDVGELEPSTVARITVRP